MPYEGKNKKQIEKLKSSLKDRKLKALVDDALTGQGNEYKLDSAWELADANDRPILSEIYLTSRDDYYDKLKPAMDIWKNIFNSLGFDTAENPFIKFLDNYFKVDGHESLDTRQVRNLNNMYASGDLSFEDIEGSGKEKTQTLFYNPELYNMDESSVAMYIRLYNQLSNPELLKRIYPQLKAKWPSLPDEIKDSDLTKIRNQIIVAKDDRPDVGPLVPKRKINDILSNLDLGSKTNKETTTRTAKKDDSVDILDKIKELSAADRENLFKNLKAEFQSELSSIKSDDIPK